MHVRTHTRSYRATGGSGALVSQTHTDTGADSSPPTFPPPSTRLMQSRAPPGPQRSNNTWLLSQTRSCLHIEMCYQGRRPDSVLLSPQVSITSGFTVQPHIPGRAPVCSQPAAPPPSPGSASCFSLFFLFLFRLI